jgi:methylmalonyl-CoA mutase N-terminal domain/subunit
LTWQQPVNNVVRTAVQALAAVMGGTQSLHTNSLDEAYALPSEQAVTIALRTQQILAYETGITTVPDPFGGSYFVEKLTADVAEAAQRYIEQIDGLGGMLPAIERGFPQAEIAEASYRYQTEVNGGERIIVGVNRFQQTEEEKVDTLEVSESVQIRQIAKLSALRRRRDAEQVRRALDRLEEGAEKQENLVPLLLDSVKSYATLGEIVAVLKRIFGTYSEPSVL